jgi:signal transduction histidine kinase
MRWPSLSLSARLYLIVVGGMLLATLLSSLIHSHDRARWIGENRETAAIDHLADTLRLLALMPAAQRPLAVAALPADDWRLDPGDADQTEPGTPAPGFASRLAASLQPLTVEGAWVNWSSECQESPRCPMTYRVQTRFADGQVMTLAYVTKPRGRPERPLWQVLRPRDAFELAVMAAVAWLVVRLAMRPLQRMTRAVEAFGLDIDQPPLDDSGPVEVHRAIRAFNTMQERIRGFMAERTQILAAVTHDLKTPMTRMRLRLEHCEDAELKQKLLADLAVMQSLTDEGLELARSMSSGQPLAILDLGALLQSLCDDLADAGQPVTHAEAPAGLLVRAHPPALRRVLENIIGNAVTYGETAAVSLSRQGSRACIEVRDQGPGIPEDQFANVLKPFVRLETSRSRETGGTGLGLAIAANLLKSQHGDMALDNPPDGGLRVRITLPLAREV